jgi:hypothetical protein
MSKMDEFKAYVDAQVVELKNAMNEISGFSKEVADELDSTANEVKQTILEKLKAYVDAELDEIKKDQEPKA